MNTKDLRVGDGIIVRPNLTPIRAVVVANGCDDGVSVETKERVGGWQHIFQIGTDFDLDPQGAWAEPKPHNCANRYCYYSQKHALNKNAVTVLDYCWQCGNSFPVEKFIPEPTFNSDSLKYKRVFELTEKIERRNLQLHELQSQAEADGKAEFKKLFPRKRKYVWANLPENVRVEILAKYQPIVNFRFALKKKHREQVDKILNALAPKCELLPSPQMYVVQTSSTDTYRSQGWGKDKYAQGALAPMRDLLVKHGFSAEIAKGETTEYNTVYELRVNLQPFQYDAFSRVTTVSNKEWRESQRSAGVNPRVYNPYDTEDY